MAQVGLDNPAELKAAKLARSVTRGVLDRDARPDTGERARIAAVLQLPPNKCAPAQHSAFSTQSMVQYCAAPWLGTA